MYDLVYKEILSTTTLGKPLSSGTDTIKKHWDKKKKV